MPLKLSIFLFIFEYFCKLKFQFLLNITNVILIIKCKIKKLCEEENLLKIV